MSRPATPITWEFLEGTVHRYSSQLGEQAPTLVFKQGIYKTNLAAMRGKVPIDPELLAFLDLEESEFYVAYVMAAERENRRLLKRPGGVFNVVEGFKETHPFRFRLEWLWICLIGLIAIPALVFSAPELNIPVLCVTVLALAIVQFPWGFRYVKDFHMRMFDLASHLTGNPIAGKSFLRKYLLFYRTKRGTMPLLGWRKWLYDLGCRTTGA